MAEQYVTLYSLKHYDEKIKEVIGEKQDQLVGEEGQVVSFDADGNVISKNLEIGEDALIVDFRYKYVSDDEGYEAYDFTHTNAEIIDAINNGRTVIIKGLINTARDYAPYIFQLHTYMKNSGRYEFVYSTFSNYMEITEYKLVIYSNDNLEFLVNTYEVNQTIPEIPYGDEGQFVSFDEEGNLIAVDAPNGDGEPTLVSFVYESTDNNTWTVHSVDKTYDEIKTALSENKIVIAKGTNKNARLDNPWYFYPNEYYNSAGNWVVFERVNVNGSSAIEAFKLTVNGDGTATLVETEVSQIDLSNYVEKEEGKGLSTNDLTDELLAIINSDHTYAKFTNTTATDINSITTNGKYLIDNSSGNKTGCPSGITRFELYVFNVTRYTIQLAFGVYAATTSTTVVPTPTIWIRAKDTMTYNWSTWSMPSSSYATNAGKVNNHTVESDVPTDAKFTDTVTTVTTTGSGNAITSISATDGVVTATKGSTFLTAHPTISKSTDTTSTATATHGGTITMVDSVTRDGNGHVTKINTKTVTLPSDADTKYTHPTTSGNKHIPSGGSSGQILRWSADGTAVWGADNNTTYGVVSTTADGLAPKRDGSTTKYLRADGTWATPPDNNTTYSNMTAATSSAAGKAGLVPAPAAGAQAKFLRGDGTWQTPTNTTYSNFVKSGSGAKAGLVPAPSTTAGTTKYLREDGTWAVPPDTNTTYTHPTSGVTAGTYRSVTVNAQGHVTAGTNPTVTLAQGGTGGTDASTARTNLGVPPTSHASTATTYGKGSSSKYGHLKINDSYSSTPSTSYNASNGVAASLYGVQQLNSKYEKLEERVTELDGGSYTLVGKMSFGIGTQSINVTTVISKTNAGGTLPFTIASNDSNRVQYFTTSSNVTYYYKYVKANSAYMTVLVEGVAAPSASSVPQASNMMSATYAVNSDTMLDTIGYGSLSFKTGKYYYGCYNATTTVNRGGKLYLYTKN